MEAEGKIEESKNGFSSKESDPGDAMERDSELIRRGSFYNGEGNFKNIVLKFTTLSEGCQEAPSFTVDKRGAKVGRDASNSISVPSDTRLSAEGHATIEYHRGSFYIIDGGFNFSASIRIGSLTFIFFVFLFIDLSHIHVPFVRTYRYWKCPQ